MKDAPKKIKRACVNPECGKRFDALREEDTLCPTCATSLLFDFILKGK